MKPIKLVILFLALGLFFILPKIAGAEQIDNYQVDIVVNADSSISVEEIINYNFGSEQRHGIYRDIPYKYQARGGNYKLEIDNISVVDENGRAINFETSQSGGMFKIKIGEADVYVAGKKVYVIRYKVEGAINYFADHDELYWNATGNDWQINIVNTEATVSLNGFEQTTPNLTAACYAGAVGVTGNCEENIAEESGARFGQSNLMSGEGLTIVVGWPKGFTKEPSLGSKILKIAKDNGVIFLPIIVFIGLYLYWKKNGRDPQGRGTIIAEYEPPAGILPGEAGVVYDEKYGIEELTATIIDLASRGYFKIVEINEAEGNILGGEELFRELKLVKKAEWVGDYNYGHNLYNYFFSSREEVRLSELMKGEDFSYKIQNIKQETEEAVVKKRWFKEDPQWARTKLTITGFVFLLFCGVAFFGFIGWVAIVSLLVSAILFFIFAKLMPQKTTEGALMKEKLEGFKLFLSVTEKDRVSFHFSPSAHPEKFAEYLPWAIIFGVEKEWAKVFEGIALPQPDWYMGSLSDNFTSFYLVNSLGSFNSSFSKSAVGGAVAGGASGLGGGGFSGGGFGGGGGGSW